MSIIKFKFAITIQSCQMTKPRWHSCAKIGASKTLQRQNWAKLAESASKTHRMKKCLRLTLYKRRVITSKLLLRLNQILLQLHRTRHNQLNFPTWLNSESRSRSLSKTKTTTKLPAWPRSATQSWSSAPACSTRAGLNRTTTKQVGRKVKLTRGRQSRRSWIGLSWCKATRSNWRSAMSKSKLKSSQSSKSSKAQRLDSSHLKTSTMASLIKSRQAESHLNLEKSATSATETRLKLRGSKKSSKFMTCTSVRD